MNYAKTLVTHSFAIILMIVIILAQEDIIDFFWNLNLEARILFHLSRAFAIFEGTFAFIVFFYVLCNSSVRILGGPSLFDILKEV